MLKSFGRDDWMMLVTLALFTVYLTCQLGGIVHGTGQLRKDLTDESAEIALQVSLSQQTQFLLKLLSSSKYPSRRLEHVTNYISV